MIAGSFFSLSPYKKYSFIPDMGSLAGGENLSFHTVEDRNFTGGWFLHKQLPYNDSDFYYNDTGNDILVLISGSVFNKDELYKKYKITENVQDPELIIKMFLAVGPDFVRDLNGDFAIFIGRNKSKEAFLFRDHIGIRPLAWTNEGNALYFSSDINAMCLVFPDKNSSDKEYLLGTLKFIDYRTTASSRVKKLLPGHYLHYSASGIEITKYWKPDSIHVDKRMSHDQMLSDMKKILTNAVKIRCDHRFNAGAHVSGGLDSGIVSVLARNEYSKQKIFYGFSWSPAHFTDKDIKNDERELTRTACEKTDITPLFSKMSTDDFLRYLSDFYYNKGVFSESETLKMASDLNVNMIFSGWGGDEFISAGDRGIEIDLLKGLKFRQFFKRNPVKRPLLFLKWQFEYIIFPLTGLLAPDVAHSFRNDGRYLKKAYKQNDRRTVKNYYSFASRRQFHLNMLEVYHLQDRCETWMVNGYRHGIEYRYPLLDKRIIEYMLKVPSELLCRTDYYRPLLREIGEGILPDEIRWKWDKRDPACLSWMNNLYKEAAEFIMKEIGIWESDPEMQFVDFKKLREDIKSYKDNPDMPDNKVLLRGLVFLKGIHEFCESERMRSRSEW